MNVLAVRGRWSRRTSRAWGSVALSIVSLASVTQSSSPADPRAPALERHEYRQIAMGVEARMVLYAPSEDVAKRAARAAFARIEAIEEALSDWRATSEVRSLCAGAGGPPVAVSRDMWNVLVQAGEMARASGGAFDVTVGPLVKVWRAARADARLPSAAEIATARAACGFENVRLDAESGTVALTKRNMSLDFGGIGQGFACDEALAMLRAQGVDRALCEISGDVVASGPPPDADGWTVQVRAGASARTLSIAHAAVTTSGDTEQFVELDGVRYSHVVDPRTGWALANAASCTVIAADGATADALATAACVLGPTDAAALVARFDGAKLVSDDLRFRALFDGKTLDGWVTKGGRYDGNASWTVEDGCLTGRVGANGEGGLIYTAEPFTSFELELETKIDYPFDSGIFLRMAPQGRGAQVTLDHRSDGEIGAIYSDEFLAHNTTAKDRFQRDEWNSFRVRCTGFDMHVTVWMNGEEITDYTLPEGTPGFAPHGLIGLQVHGDRDDPPGNKVQFRNIRVRSLPVFGEELVASDAKGHTSPSDAAKKDGWMSLLGANDLSAWEAVDSPNDYKVEGGVLAIPAAAPYGYLRTRDDFGDFRLRLDFKLAKMANSGVFLRGVRDGSNPAYSGCEVQLLDDVNWEAVTKSTLKDWQFTGSLYGSVAAGLKGVMHPIGEWNTLEVLYQGSRLAVALNGVALYDVDTTKVPGDPPFERRAKKGFIGLQRYAAPTVEGGAAAWVRNVFVQEL